MSPSPRHRPLAAACCALLLGSCSGSTPAEPYAATAREAQAAADEVLGRGAATSLAIALTDTRGTILARGYGPADRATGRAATPDTPYCIGSSSKVFAAVAVMQLVEEGRIGLDESVAAHVPAFRMAAPEFRDVTARTLLDHSAGLMGTDGRGVFTTTPFPAYGAQARAALATQRLKTAPRLMSVYCNDCFTLVESLVEGVTGTGYRTYVEERILRPLGMARSRFPVPAPSEAEVARAYSGDGTVRPVEVVNAHASGGLYSTASDLARFARMFLNGGMGDQGRVLTAASVEEMGVNHVAGSFWPVDLASMSYGLGWDSVRSPALEVLGIRAWSKGGDSGDYHSRILVAPDEGLAVVVVQASSADARDATAERVLLRALAERGRIAFPEPLAGPPAPVAEPPDGLLARMEGSYARYDGVRRVEAQADGTLTVTQFTASSSAVIATGLRYRSDGWFTSDARPLQSIRIVEAAGRTYLADRMPVGYGHCLDTVLSGERVDGGTTPLRPAWAARLGRSWVGVNEHPDSTSWLDWPYPPAVQVSVRPELPGLLLAMAPGTEGQVLDPSESDDRAVTRIRIPGITGRDLEDLEVLPSGGEEWMRWGAYVLRPLESVPPVPRHATTAVAIGAEGYGEWRALPPAAEAVRVTLRGVTAWRAFDGEVRSVANGHGDCTTTLPAGPGSRYLLVHGAPGATVAIGVE